MTTKQKPVCIPLPADSGMEETPSGPMSTEWLDEVWQAVPISGNRDPLSKYKAWNFTAAEFALLAQMQGVGAAEAARRLCGEGEE